MTVFVYILGFFLRSEPHPHKNYVYTTVLIILIQLIVLFENVPKFNILNI